jgi:endonuclease YncB( thermonuclease family)
MMTNGAMRLKEGERGAKQQRAGIWRDYVPPASAGTRLGDEYEVCISRLIILGYKCLLKPLLASSRLILIVSIYSQGKVIEVVSGDIVVVKDPNGVEQRFSLARSTSPILPILCTPARTLTFPAPSAV